MKHKRYKITFWLIYIIIYIHLMYHYHEVTTMDSLLMPFLFGFIWIGYAIHLMLFEKRVK